MKKIAVILLALLCSHACLAQETPIIIHSFQDTACGAWSTSASEPVVRAQDLAWFRGFVSGFNFATPKHQVGLDTMPDNQTLALFVDKYCREHPLNPFVSAAVPLVRELTHANNATAN